MNLTSWACYTLLRLLLFPNWIYLTNYKQTIAICWSLPVAVFMLCNDFLLILIIASYYIYTSINNFMNGGTNSFFASYFSSIKIYLTLIFFLMVNILWYLKQTLQTRSKIIISSISTLTKKRILTIFFVVFYMKHIVCVL